MTKSAVRTLASVVAVLCLVAGGVFGWLALRPSPAAPGSVADLDGNQVVADDLPDVAATDPVPTGGRFVAPNQGLDVPLYEMDVVDNVINPPSMADAFLVRGYGSPSDPATGLVVVAMHSVRDGNGPGNAFFEVRPDSSPVTIQSGDELQVDGVTYVVTGYKVVAKTDATGSGAIWANPSERKGELVVLTCLQRAGERGSARDNLVIFAQQAS
jgi:hypothetical protein